jgi:simple sugar transport system substrate-binding protein
MRRLRRSPVAPSQPPRRLLAIALAVAAAGLLLAACGGSSKSSSSSTSAVNISSGSGGKVCNYKFAVITHGDNGNFWAVVYKGAKDAAKDLGCTLTQVYGSQQQGQAEPDDNAQNAQIQNAINAHVDGLVVSDHAPSLMNPALAAAAAKGIPVVLLNAGCDNKDIAASGALTCVGQPEQLAGVAAAQRFVKLGSTNVLCVIHQSGQNLLDRCNGIAQGLGVGTCKTGSPASKGPGCTELTLSTPNAASNPQQAIGQVTSYLQAHPQINAVMTLNTAIGTALVNSHPPGSPKIATFDLSSDVQSELQSKTMAFAVDQQQYLQGYLPIEFLYIYKKHEGNSTGGGTTVASGPLIVDDTNISKVAAAIAAGDD